MSFLREFVIVAVLLSALCAASHCRIVVTASLAPKGCSLATTRSPFDATSRSSRVVRNVGGSHQRLLRLRDAPSLPIQRAFGRLARVAPSFASAIPGSPADSGSSAGNDKRLVPKQGGRAFNALETGKFCHPHRNILPRYRNCGGPGLEKSAASACAQRSLADQRRQIARD